jgi:hypothetical protein
VLAVTAPAQLAESAAETAERLAFKDARRLAASRAAAEGRYYSQFNFRPRINAHSRRIAKVGAGEGRARAQPPLVLHQSPVTVILAFLVSLLCKQQLGSWGGGRGAVCLLTSLSSLAPGELGGRPAGRRPRQALA